MHTDYQAGFAEGIWSGIPTPWQGNEQLDRAALRRTVDRCIRTGAARMTVIDTDIKGPLRELGYRKGSMDRLMGMATGFLEPVYQRLLLPWRSVRPEHVALAREKVVQHLGEGHLFTEGA